MRLLITKYDALLINLIFMQLSTSKRGSVILLSLVFLLSGCEKPNRSEQYPFNYSNLIMGTSFTIKVSVLPENISIDQLKSKIDNKLKILDSQFSTYKSDSELSKINNNQTFDWINVSEPLFTVLKAANTISEFSDGAFDITIGPLVNMWGFGPDPSVISEPDPLEITEKLKQIGFRNLVFDDQFRIKKKIPSLYIDLSAIAKGYAVDQIAELLDQENVNHYMVEIGGELQLKGMNINNEPWKIAIEKPEVNQRKIQKVLSITDIAMATSGDYRNYFEVDGVRYSHTIDPRTGYPITHKLASVTILSETTMEADALATSMMVLGSDEGFQIAEKNNILALFIIKTEAGFVEKPTSAMADYL